MDDNRNRPQSQRAPQRGPMRFGPQLHGEKPKDFKGTLKKLIAYIGPFKFAVLIVVILAVCSTVFSIAGPKILARAIDTLSKGVLATAQGTGSIDFDAISQTLILLGALYLTSALLSYAQGWIMAGTTNKISYRLRQDISQKFHRLPLKYFESTSQGDVLSRVTNDVDTINMSMNQSMVQVIRSTTVILGASVMMLSINPLMTIIIFIVLPFSVVITTRIVKLSQPIYVSQQRTLGALNGHTEETYGGQMVVRAFRGEHTRIDAFNELNSQLYSTAWRSQFFSSLTMPATMLIGNLSYVITCVFGAYLAGRGVISLGDIQAFINYVRNFNQSMSEVTNLTNMFQSMAAAAERVFEFLSQPEEVSEDKNPVTVVRKDGKIMLAYTDENGAAHEQQFFGNIEFVNVRFSYDPGKEVIRGFSAFVPAGQKVAIVGHTGAGKTTIVKLLMRFYDVQQGAILIDGLDIRRFTRDSLRGLFGMVLQDTWLYNDSIEQNIRYGRRSATRDEVVEASRAAGVDHFVRTLPGGYDVEINEESSNISSGQKQLLTIARAILADPQVLILDEATSSVDTKTEVDIQRAMQHLMHGRTNFIIAHRLSTIRDCGLILMMENGDIVEHGDHYSLLEKGGAYAELYNSQFENV